MSRTPIYPRRHNLYTQISLDLADAIVARAREEQVPQRVIVVAALRAFLNAGSTFEITQPTHSAKP
jgi:hypothetical protein